MLAVDTVGSSRAEAGALAELVEREMTEAVGSHGLSITLIVDDGRTDTPLARSSCFAGTSFFLERRNAVREERDRNEAVETLVRSLQDVIGESTTDSLPPLLVIAGSSAKSKDLDTRSKYPILWIYEVWEVSRMGLSLAGRGQTLILMHRPETAAPGLAHPGR